MKDTDFDIYAVLSEYAPTDDVMSEDDTLTRNLKTVIYRRLDETERRIILAYAELGSIRDTARLFRVSPTTIWLRIQQIRNKIKDYLK